MTPPLDDLAARAAPFHWFLAHQLARYAAANGLTDDALAQLLRIPVRRLARLRLCSRVRVENPDTRNRDVRDLVARFGCDADALMRAVLGCADGDASKGPIPGPLAEPIGTPHRPGWARSSERVAPGP